MSFFKRIKLAHKTARKQIGSPKRKKSIQSKPKKTERTRERSFLVNKNFSGKRYKRDKVFKTKTQAIKRKNEIKSIKFVRISTQKEGSATYTRKK